MLTIGRQCRSPKGARKPVVGPVACYRGAEVNDSRMCICGVAAAEKGDTRRDGLFAPFYGGCVDRIAPERAHFWRRAMAGGGTDGYEIYIKPARGRTGQTGHESLPGAWGRTAGPCPAVRSSYNPASHRQVVRGTRRGSVAERRNTNNEKHPESVADQTLPSRAAGESTPPWPSDADLGNSVPFGEGFSARGDANVGRPVPVIHAIPHPGTLAADVHQTRRRDGGD